MTLNIPTSTGDRKFDMSAGHQISIPVKAGTESVNAWYLDPVRIEPVMTEQFTGDVNAGGPVNFRNIYFNPHGHGTHTECVGHISKEDHRINSIDLTTPLIAQVVTVQPHQRNGDMIVDASCLPTLEPGVTALVICTLPNEPDKLIKHYSDTNPPYFDLDLIPILNTAGIRHLLLDCPSVDKEQDGGELAFHHAFWGYPEKPDLTRTITELIYVSDAVEDGIHALLLNAANFENDAAPSNPTLYPEIE